MCPFHESRHRLYSLPSLSSPNRTGSIASRSETLHRQLQERARNRSINFVAHSMGGLDCRHLISHIRPTQYEPLSLTTISTPHRGSQFMDWCVVRTVPFFLSRPNPKILCSGPHRNRKTTREGNPSDRAARQHSHTPTYSFTQFSFSFPPLR
jgi:hypothetical protein